MRSDSEAKPLRSQNSGFVPHPGDAAIRLSLIIDDDFIDGWMVLQKLLAQRQAEHGQFFYRKPAPQLGDERQCQDGIA
jgi:hypothetical protein